METLVDENKLQYMLKGFTQTLGLRIFEFEGVAADRSRRSFTVSADMAASRRYGIRIQDLPLLCRAVLDGHEPTDSLPQEGTTQAFTYTEEEMSLHASRAAAREAAQKKRPPRRPSPDRLGAAWRTSPRPVEPPRPA